MAPVVCKATARGAACETKRAGTPLGQMLANHTARVPRNEAEPASAEAKSTTMRMQLRAGRNSAG